MRTIFNKRGPNRGLLLCVFFFVFWSTSAFAQATGTIRGIVIDSETGEPVFGVAVVPEGSDAFAQTDFEGRYTLTLPPGDYNIVFQGVTYQNQSRKITVSAGQVANANVTMGIQALDVVDVQDRALNNTEASLLALQRKSAAVSDGISAEAIKRSPDSSASDVLKRVTGITIVGGKFVFVRGLGERYSNSELNGAPLASPEPDKRVVPLDLFPAGLIKNIRIIKSFLPEDSAEFSGGIVKIETKEFPDEFTLSIGLGLGGNYNTTQRHFSTYKGSGTDYLGKDNGKRDQPVELPEWLRLVRGNIFGGIPETGVQLIGSLFPNTWDPKTISAPFDRDVKFTIGDSIQLGEQGSGGRFGYLYGTSYSRKFRKREEKEISFNSVNLAGLPTTDDSLIFPEVDRETTRNVEEVLWGHNLNFSYEPIANQRLKSQTFYSRNSDKFVTEGQGTAVPISEGPFQFRTLNTGWVGREVIHHVFAGEHALNLVKGGRPHKLEWSYYNSQALRDEPNLTQQLWKRGPDDPTVFVGDTGSARNGWRYYSDTEDNTDGVSLDYEIPFLQWSGLLAKFKLGAEASDRSKNFRSDFYTNELVVGNTPAIEGVPGSVLYNGPFLLSGRYRFAEEENFDAYDAEHKVHAYYGQIDTPIVNKFRFIGGARYEDSYQFVRTYITSSSGPSGFYFPWQYDIGAPGRRAKPGVGELATKDTLPSANVVWEFHPEMNLRLGYTETLNRPDFRDLSEFGFQSEFGGETVFGNPDLNRAYIHNYDARWEWYLAAEDYLGAGVFYKEISGPITKIGLGSQNLARNVSFLNAEDGNIRGLELEFRKLFFDSFAFQTNVFVIRSRVELLQWEDFAAIRLGLVDRFSRVALYNPSVLESQIVGQSDFVSNFKLSYFVNPEKTGSIGLLYNVFGDRLNTVGANGNPNTIEKGAGVLDFVYEQKFGENLSVKASVKNILDTRFKVVQENPLLGNREELVRSYREGVSYSASLDYKF
jgi:outer membrane receptor protein involved in Fe transport